MTKQSGLQSRKQRDALLAQGGQIATNARESMCPGQRAEAAGDLLLDFDHAQIALGQVVVKRHPQIFQKGQHGVLIGAQAIQQIAGRTLFDASAMPWRSRGPWVSLVSLVEQGQELPLPIDN